MVFEMQFVRKAYTQVLAHEIKKVVRMVREYPHDRFDRRENGCGQTARELAEDCVAHLRRIDAIACGMSSPSSQAGPRPRGAILLDLETSYLSASAALQSLPSPRWSELVNTPRGLHAWKHARRGELLWLALREMGRHHRHFSMHSRSECQCDSGHLERLPQEQMEPATVGV